MYLVRSPFWLKWYYPNLTWNQAKESSNDIFLTFDDGPIPIVTPFVLNILKKYEIKATFFCIGTNIEKNPSIFEQIKDEGHAIGNHTFNHLKGWKTKDHTYLGNIEQCHQLTQSKLFRPPYGRIKKSQIALLKPNYQLIMWSVLSGDFDINLSPERCLRNVIQKTRAGDIVVFHDSEKAFKRLEYTLPKAIEFWLSKGYNFKKL